MASYGLGHGKAMVYWVFIFIHMVQEFWKVWFLHLGELINLGWIIWYVLAETLIQNDAPEEGSYSVLDDLEYTVV